MSLFNKLPNSDATLVALVKLINPKIKPADVTDELSIHPDYPNLIALSDVLTNFGIDAGAYRIEAAELPDVPCPFIAHTYKTGSEFMLVTALADNTFTLSDGDKQQQLKFDDFVKIFDGIVLVPDVTGQTTDKAPAPSKFSLDEIRYPVAVALLLFALIAGVLSYSTVFTGWAFALAALFKTAGLAVSVLLLIQSIDKNNPFVQTLCGGGGKTNCNAILSSKAANVFEGLSWSDVGFFYFAGTWLALLFGGGSIAMLQALAVLNIISLPYTVYSIYYQARVAKQWCVFCCAVQALLWLEFIPLVSSLSGPFVWLNINEIIGLLICLALPAALWLLLKPLLLKAQQAVSLKEQLRKFKYNSELFNSLLKEQPKYAQPAPAWSIILGNPDAENVVTMVSNPYCPPCSKTHNLLDDWLNHNPDLQARIVFTADNTENDMKTPVVRHLMALNQLADRAVVKQALHDWYNQTQKSYTAWAKAYPVQMEEAGFAQLDKQNHWCHLAEIKATPTLLINGYRLPDAYQIKDIKYMLG
ncbi:vitamin K epoxide reductase family protein [Mucilaginibacter phyllosphaerae]